MSVDLGEMAEKALRIVVESKEMVYDTESSGLDWRYNNPIGYVIGAPDASYTGPSKGLPVDTVYVPVRHGGGGNLPGCKPLVTPTDKIDVHPFELALAKAFEERNRLGRGRVVGHNMKFDVHMSANAGVLLGRNLACTQNMAAMLDEYARSYSLDACSERYGVEAKKGTELYRMLSANFGGPPERSAMQHFWKTAGNDPLVMEYTIGDGVSTMQLFRYENAMLDDQEMAVVRDLENDLIWTVFRMERKGIKVDKSRIDDLRRATEAQISDALSKFPLGFNTRSPVQVKKVMEEAGHVDWPTTEKGSPSFTESWLKKSDLGKEIIRIRQLSNLLNSFVNPLDTRHMFNGRVHASLNQLKSDEMGTISGRFSCSDPNLQQVPKRVKALAKPFRSLFVADEGYKFFERDYSQCEPRLFAHYSQDENLVHGYNQRPFVDAHQTVADMLSVERDPTAKRMNMGIFTGMQPRTFAGHMGWDLATATEKWEAWFKAFPGVRKFQNNAKARLMSRGYVYTLLKRRCRLEAPRFAYRGTSKIIQGGNADILKYKLREVDRICEDHGDIVQILMTVHDSFNGQVLDVPEAWALFGEIQKVLVDVQKEPFNLSVPFEIDGYEGDDWCQATFGA